MSRRASTDVLALVITPQIEALLGRTLTKDRAFCALAARVELAERMRRRGLAIEIARVLDLGSADRHDPANHDEPHR